MSLKLRRGQRQRRRRQDKEQYIVEHVTNLSPFDKSMIDKSEDRKGK